MKKIYVLGENSKKLEDVAMTTTWKAWYHDHEIIIPNTQGISEVVYEQATKLGACFHIVGVRQNPIFVYPYKNIRPLLASNSEKSWTKQLNEWAIRNTDCLVVISSFLNSNMIAAVKYAQLIKKTVVIREVEKSIR